MIREYGLAEGIYRYMELFFLHRKIMIDEWYVDGITVDKDMRGKGVGTTIWKFCKKMAYGRSHLMS